MGTERSRLAEVPGRVKAGADYDHWRPLRSLSGKNITLRCL